MKGIVLAGGAGSRLYPVTLVASKQLQPVYDKPMIFYPIATLMEAGIRELLLISTPIDTPRFRALLGDGSQWGISISYQVQEAPRGIAEALLIGEEFIGGEPVTLILGDNIFHGDVGLDRIVAEFVDGAVVFAFPVRDPQRYGVVELTESGRPVGIEEKPRTPRSRLAVTGLYVFDGSAAEIARSLDPSGRGELEITDVNRRYLDRGMLEVRVMPRGVAWLDSGTHDSLLDAANFVATVERRQSVKVACLEEIALARKFITPEELDRALAAMPHSTYRDYVISIAAR